MSLRQRGQRPSEATNEGGFYGQQPSYNASTPGGDSGHQGTPQQQQQPPRSSPPSSSGSGYGGSYNNPSSGAGGGYYGAPNTPSASSSGYGGGYNVNTPVNQHQQPAQQQASYSNTNAAPPAYNNNQGQGGGYNYGGGSSGGYGGYASSNSGSNAGVGVGIGGGAGMMASASASSSNPYQKSKPSSSSSSAGSGFSFKHILLSLFAITFLSLTCTTIYFRSLMKQHEASLQKAKDNLKQHEARTGGRYAQAKTRQNRVHDGVKYGKDTNERKKLEDQIASLQTNLEKAQARHDGELTHQMANLNTDLTELQTKKQDLLHTIDHTKYQLEDMADETAKYRSMVEGISEVEEYMKNREGALNSRIEVLEGKIGRESWRESAEWFGPGPHKVELEFEYPKVTDPNADPTTWPRVRNKITIEMAALDVMPHTVNFFLQQVHHQLWDGASMVTNAQHVYQLGPCYEEETEVNAPHYDHFYEKGLDKISYQEYNKQYPHTQWTLGFAGRPGGPDFYINKLDNSLIHGPGGQTNEEDMHNEADPCFGRIVDGFATLEEIDLIPVDAEKNYVMKHPVKIVRASVLVPKENPAEGWREIKAGEQFDEGDDVVKPLENSFVP